MINFETYFKNYFKVDLDDTVSVYSAYFAPSLPKFKLLSWLIKLYFGKQYCGKSPLLSCRFPGKDNDGIQNMYSIYLTDGKDNSESRLFVTKLALLNHGRY